MSSTAPPPSSSGPPTVDLPDPVVEIIVGAGHRVGPGVVECAQLAAAAHAERHASRQADGPAVNRSTFIWALGRVDVEVRSALAVSGVDIDEWGRELGIAGDGRPTGERYALAVELDRAIRAFVTRPSKMQLTVTTWALAVAVFEDIARHNGLAADRLRQFGTSAEAVLADLRMPSADAPDATGPAEAVARDGSGGDRSGGEGSGDLPLVREVEPRRFGVQLPRGAEPRPYVPRDVDTDLDRRLREHEPVVALEAPAVSGAIRTVYEALLRMRPDDRILLLHEWLQDRTGAHQPALDEVERLLSSGADLVWVRNLGELLLLHPVLGEWFASRGDAVAATIVLIVRPEDTERAASLGLLPDPPLRMSRELTPEEQSRADALYDGEVMQVSSIASATVRRPGSTRATYAADSAVAALLDEAHDDLDIRGDVDMLARLIASKDVHPPLSIGLFGPWGSGKSFIMKQVQGRVEQLARQSRELNERNRELREKGETEGTKETGYLAEILPVEFNAWQYAHGEALWASLINRVFEQIRERMSDDKRYHDMLRDLADKDHAVAQARVRLDAAQAEVSRTTPAASDRVIEKVAADHDMSTVATEQIRTGLDLDVTRQQVSDLRAEYDKLRTTGARWRRGWSKASPQRKRLIVTLGVVGACLLVAAGAIWLLDRETYTATVTALVGLAPLMGGLLGGLLKVLRPVNKGFEQAEKLLRADKADKEQLRQAQEDLVRATDALAAARTAGLAGLYGFVSDRSTAAEYRQQLGMAPMIRDDLAKLASLARGVEGSHGIDRIVIFIDDLDRCPAAEVVRVLEAVNLLFGFELFVVVVAVDSRWLIRSLDGQFSEAFDAKDPEAPTPQNYLEKIIQIPFWVQPMAPDGFSKLVTSLAGRVDVRRKPGDATVGRGEASRGEPEVGRDEWPVREDEGRGGEDDGGAVTRHTDDGGEAGPVDGDVAVQTEEVARQEEDLNPAALRLTSDERDLMTHFLPLVQTPRAVKRFLNTYQLLRVSVDDVEAFLDRKEYAPVLVLLALMTGTVRLTDEMVDELAAMRESNLEEFLSTLPEKPQPNGTDANATDEVDPWAMWRPVAVACAGVPTQTLTPEIVTKWMQKVARYSFHHVQVEASSRPTPEPSS